MHRIRRGKLSSIAPTARHPNIEPPVWKGFRKWLLTRIVIRIPIDSYAVGVQGKLRARGDLADIRALPSFVQRPIAVSGIAKHLFDLFATIWCIHLSFQSLAARYWAEILLD